MEEIINRIQKEVDEQNREEEKKAKEQKLKEVPKFDKDNLFTINFGGIENSIRYLLENVEKLAKQVDKAEKDIKSRAYVVDKLHKEGTDRDDKVKEMEK